MGRYRYMEASVWVDWHWIVSLDQADWELRGLPLSIQSRRGRSSSKASGHRLSGSGRPSGTNFENRNDPAREPLLWHIGYFGRGRRTIMVRGGFTSVNSPLFLKAELLDEILKFADVPKDVVKAYRDHALKAKAEKKR